jgi:hypothetical protein
MKIVASCKITGRGDAVFTDEPFSWAVWKIAKEKKRIRVAGEGRVVEIEIRSAESALKEGGETLGFLVPPFEDSATREFIIGRDAELV